MIAKIDISWNTQCSNDGLLYFYQRIVEMLDYTTIDIYRAPLLNTNRLMDEYMQVSSGAAKEYNLEEIYSELLYSFQNDIILSFKLKETQKQQIECRLKNKDTRLETIKFLTCAIGHNYLSWTKEYLLDIVPQYRQKKKIERAIRCFIPELLYYGYSRDEIYHHANSILKSNDSSIISLDKFLNRYDCKVHKYDVYLGISNTLFKFNEILNRKLGIVFVDDGRFNRLNTSSQFHVIKVPNIQAIDASSAANIALKKIEIFSTIYQFLGDYGKNVIQSSAIVIDEKGSERSLVVNREKFKSIEKDDSSKIGELSEYIINNLIYGARCSMPKLQKIMQIHNRAISNNGLENGFLNLWSIMEMICVSDSNSSKIDQVLKITVPVIKGDYLIAIFKDIADNLKKVLNDSEYSQLISNIEDGNSENEKIASWILLPQYAEHFDNFVDCLGNYPVLRSRMLNLHDKCSKRNQLNNLANKYAKRVSWHIYRIYRARNIITHSGRTPDNIKDLGEHLHTYVDCLINELIVKLSVGSLCYFSNVFIDSELYQENYDKYFNENKSIDIEGIQLIFSQDKLWIES